MWNILKEIGYNIKNKKNSSELINIKDTPKNSLNHVNHYFTSIGRDLASEIYSQPEYCDDKRFIFEKKQHIVDSMFMSPTNCKEVKKIIFSLKKGFSGNDNISGKTIKTLHEVLIEPIVHLCNLSMETGIFPDIFKQAVVIPIFKSGDDFIPSNYRPISLLSTLSKILEKIVHKRLLSFLDKHQILAPNQYGFRPNHSTEDAVLKLTTTVTSHLDKGEKRLGVFLDLKKAFDTVPIPKLISILDDIGIRGITKQWFNNYLTDRVQCVRVLGQFSDNLPCEYGVPQGSTLGPLLFLIYINQLCQLKLDKSSLIMYADDTVIVFHDRTWDDVKTTAEIGLSLISTWLQNHLLTLNTNKSYIMCFSNSSAGEAMEYLKIIIHSHSCRKLKHKISNQCDCEGLNRVSTIKYLGITIDNRLNWKPHVSNMAKKRRRLIILFKNLRQVLNIKHIIIIYKSLCECILTYCISAWGGAAKSIIVTLERAQRTVLKVAMGLSFRHPTVLVYNKSKTLNVRQLFISKCILRYHCTTVTKTPTAPKRLNKYEFPRVKSTLARRSYEFIAPILYSVADKILSIKTCNKYSAKMKIIEWLKTLDYTNTEDLMMIQK